MKVLSTRLADNSWVRLEGINVLSNFFPQVLEDSRRTGKVQRGEIRVFESLFANLLWWPGNELDHVPRETCFVQNLKDEVVG